MKIETMTPIKEGQELEAKVSFLHRNGKEMMAAILKGKAGYGEGGKLTFEPTGPMPVLPCGFFNHNYMDEEEKSPGPIRSGWLVCRIKAKADYFGKAEPNLQYMYYDAWVDNLASASLWPSEDEAIADLSLCDKSICDKPRDPHCTDLLPSNGQYFYFVQKTFVSAGIPNRKTKSDEKKRD